MCLHIYIHIYLLKRIPVYVYLYMYTHTYSHLSLVTCHLSLQLVRDKIVGKALRADASRKGDEASLGSARPQELRIAAPAAAAVPHLSAARVSGVGPP